jgi:hypothetical protein
LLYQLASFTSYSFVGVPGGLTRSVITPAGL